MNIVYNVFEYLNYLILIKKSEEPQRNLIPFADFRVVSGVSYVVVASNFPVVGITDAESVLSVYDVITGLAADVHFVVFLQGSDKECLHYVLLTECHWIYDILQVCVMQHHPCRLLRKLFAYRINDVNQTCLSEVLDVVHNGCTACAYVFR